MQSHLLIDGDVVAFIAASAVQKAIEDENGLMTFWADPTEGEIAVERLLGEIRGLRKDATETIFLSDKWNWRFPATIAQTDPSTGSSTRPPIRSPSGRARGETASSGMRIRPRTRHSLRAPFPTSRSTTPAS